MGQHDGHQAVRGCRQRIVDDERLVSLSLPVFDFRQANAFSLRPGTPAPCSQ